MRDPFHEPKVIVAALQREITAVNSPECCIHF